MEIQNCVSGAIVEEKPFVTTEIPPKETIKLS